MISINLRYWIGLPLFSVAACSSNNSNQFTAFSTDAVSERIALTNVTVIDGTRAAPLSAQTVLIEGQRIIAVTDSPAADITDAIIIEGDDKFLMPALWDAHAHSFADKNVLNMFLVNGIGYLRDMASDP